MSQSKLFKTVLVARIKMSFGLSFIALDIVVTLIDFVIDSVFREVNIRFKSLLVFIVGWLLILAIFDDSLDLVNLNKVTSTKVLKKDF